jgi:hypothetical protein
MIDAEKLDRIGSAIYWGYELLDSFEALDTDKIAEYTEVKQLWATLDDLDTAINSLKEAREIIVELLRTEQ